MGVATLAAMSFATSSDRVKRALAAWVGFAVGILPLACLNRVRFGAWNPISYGPIPWPNINPALYGATASNEVRYVLPVFALVALATGAAIALRKKKYAIPLVLLVTVIVGMSVAPLRERIGRMSVVALGNLIDLTFVEMGKPYPRLPDGLGRMFGGGVPKSVLQCTPIFILAPLALRAAAERRAIVVLFAPIVALAGALIIRAEHPYVDAIGWPWIYIRYTFPALPMIAVAATCVIESVRPKAAHAVVAIVVGAALARALWIGEDQLLWRRQLVLILPLLAAVVTLACVVVSLRKPNAFAPLAVAICAGIGFGITLGHDLRANVLVKAGCDEYVDIIARAVPQRFAFAGTLGDLDVPLSLAATHDIQYADTLRLDDFGQIRPLFDHWREERRPIFMMAPELPKSLWPDVEIVHAEGGPPGLFAVRFVE